MKNLSRRSLIKAWASVAAGSVVAGNALRIGADEPHEADSVAAPGAGKQEASFKSPVDCVNVLFGTSALDDPQLLGNVPPPGEEMYTGMTIPGASMPHGIDISPVNKDISLSYPHGNLYAYIYPRRTMLGFSTMVNDMLVMPLVGDWTTPPDRIRYASSYSKESEKSEPGQYSVYFPDHKIKVDLTATALTGMFRITFPKTDRATILLDLGPLASSSIEVVGDRTLRGKSSDSKSCFIFEFSKPFESFGTFKRIPSAPGMIGYGWSLLGADVVTPEKRSESGSFAGCYLNYRTNESEVILAKIAAGSSYEQAERSMQQENPSWSFEQTRGAASAAWSQVLNKIEVKGGTEKQRRIFYSCLYHAFASPTMVAHKGSEYLGLDKKLHIAEYDRYDEVPYWDTGRNQVVLLTLLEPERKENILRSQLDRAAESGWMETSFHGDHAVAMFLGDWERDLHFDYEGVYKYLYKNATDPGGPREKLAEYLKKGWIHDLKCDHPNPPYEEGNAGVSKTLEYCYDDYCLSLYAAKLGKDSDARMFAQRAKNYRNVWDASLGFMRGRSEDGAWLAPFDPEQPYYSYMFKEASSWQMSWFVPHDVKALIELMGGRQAFIAKLDTFFTLPYQPKAIARDITGMIGQYCHGNEPDHQVPFYYNWAGEPWKTQELVRKILHLMYGSDRDGLGLAGMDDQGENCSWYVMNAMGFYTVDPARAEYIIGSPIFDEVTIHMGNGKDFTIVAMNNSETNLYIQSAELNGEPLERPWFTHAAIANGGRLVLKMGPKPNKSWGSSAEAAPHSMSD